MLCEPGVCRVERQRCHRLRVAHADAAHSPAPCAYPQTSVLIGFEHAHTVVCQRGVCLGVVAELPLTRGTSVQTSLDGAHPQSAVLLGIDGIHGIGREAAFLLVVAVVARQQFARHQFRYASCLRSHPYLSVSHHYVAHEVAAQREARCAGSPALEHVLRLAEEAHSSQRSRHQRTIVTQCEARHIVVGKRCSVCRAAVVRHLARLVVQPVQPMVGRYPCAVAAPQEVGDVVSV